MLGAAVIVFREALEAALVISIVLAITRTLPGRMRWIVGGAAAGVLGAIGVAGMAEMISNAADGLGQEYFNAGVLLAAVLMLAWHNIWAGQHGREMAGALREMGTGVSNGSRPLSALAIVIGLAVLREGAEIVLFLNGLAAGGDDASSLLLGSLLGLVGGAATGVLLYAGLLRIPLGRFFEVTSWLLLLLAAGLAASAAGFLEQAGVVPTLVDTLWDTSSVLSEQSVPGQVLHVLIGYHERPSGIQGVFWLVTFLTIFSATRIVEARNASPRPAVS